MEKVLPSTLRRYREALRPFVAYLLENIFSPSEAAEWDDLLMEYKHEHTPRRAAFEALVAALEFANPRVKGGLTWCRVTLTGWAISAPIHHTVPLLRAPCRLLACYIAAAGRPRVAGGLVVQRELGLRPGEVTALFPDDVTLPESLAAGAGAVRAIVSLGTRKSTKAKRIQSVIVRNPFVIGVLRWLIHTCAPQATLMGCSYDTYRKLLRTAQTSARLEAGYTPHSPRAGFATESIAEGLDFVAVREAGRWLSDTSLRVYLDLVGAASLAQLQKQQGREAELVYAATHVLDFFPGALKFQHREDHEGAATEDIFGAGSAAWAGRPVVSRVGCDKRPNPAGLPGAETHKGPDADESSSSDNGGAPRVTWCSSVGGEEAGGSSEQGNGRPAQRGRGRGQARGGRGARGRGQQASSARSSR